jgi:hypothetical protein
MKHVMLFLVAASALTAGELVIGKPESSTNAPWCGI